MEGIFSEPHTPFRKKPQHSGGTFQLPRRRQIKQGCAGEIPPSPFSFEFVIARRGVAVCRHTLGSVKWEVFIETHAVLSGQDTVKSHFHSYQPELIQNNAPGALLQRAENHPPNKRLRKRLLLSFLLPPPPPPLFPVLFSVPVRPPV